MCRRVLVLLLALCLFETAVAMPGGRLCGIKLIEAVSKVCRGSTRQRGSGEDFNFAPSRSITTECCKKRCSFETLQSFCPDKS